MAKKLIERDALLFEAGDYPDKGISVSVADLDSVINNSGEVPVKIEHVDTALDGAMGSVTRLWRKGKQLWGSVSFPDSVWDLITAAKAYRLSVGLNFGETPSLTEVSIVRHPRVATARIFTVEDAPDHVKFAGFLVAMGLGDLSTGDIQAKLYELLNPDPMSEHYLWIEDLYQDSVVVTDGTKTYRHTLDVQGDDIILGDAVEVRRYWQPIGSEPEPASALSKTPTEDDKMSETITMSAEEFSSKIAEAKAEAAQAATKQVELFKAELTARAKAESTARELVAAGKVPESTFSQAVTILTAGDEIAKAFCDICEMQVTATTEVKTSNDVDNFASRLFQRLGVDAETVAKYKEAN